MKSNLLPEYQQINVVVASRDGRIAVHLTLYEGTYPIPNRIAVGCYFSLEMPDNGGTSRVGVLFSDHFEFVQPQAFGLPATIARDTFQLECAYATIGEYLDSDGLLPLTPSGVSATQLNCFGSQFKEWEERPVGKDDDVLAYVRAKLYASWRFELDETVFSSADCLRLHASLRTIKRTLEIEEGILWTVSESNEFRVSVKPLPRFLKDQRESFQASNTLDAPTISHLLSAPRYAGPSTQWGKAEQFAYGEHRDWANAGKEAVSSVEGLARIITGAHKETLGDLIKRLKTDYAIDPAMVKTLEGIWGFACNAPGVRHGGVSEPTISEGEARYLLDMSAAAIRYLLTLDRN